MMKLLRTAAVLLLAAAGGLAIPSPAQAGGWATTLLDPLPERLEAGTTYTVGYWVLQHGSHPYAGNLGTTALRLSDDAGRVDTYPGTPLPEAGHYAAAVVFGHPGTWRLSSVQGIFADYEIGEVAVPGGLTLRPTPTPMVSAHGDGDHWGAVRPPLSADLMPAGSTPSPSRSTAAGAQSSGGDFVPGALIGGGVLAAATLTLLLMWRLQSRMPSRSAAGPRSSSP